MFKFKNLKTICCAAVLSLGLAACGGGGGDDQGMMEPPPPPPPVPVDLSGVTAGYMAAAGSVEIAAGHSTTVGDVTFSCAADGADCTVTVAADGTATATADSGMVGAANSSAYQARLDMDAERMTVGMAVSAAMTAVSGLTNQSSDADIAAAQAAITAATAAVGATTSLPASEIVAAQAQIATAQTNLNTATMQIANYRTHGMQHAEATAAVGRATMAVGNLTAQSSDADVAAAERLVAAAKTAVAAGTMLTAGEMTALNAAIQTAETNLGTVKIAINSRKTHEQQYATAMTMVEAAETAVAGITAMSTDADVTAAKNAIAAAEAAVTAGTSLTAGQVASLNGEIALVKLSLQAAETQIANHRTYQHQLTTATNAVDAAETAIANLTVDSTDAEVEAAETLVATAKQAIADGSMLTTDEKATLNGDLTLAEASLGTTKAQIALRKARDDAQQIVRLHGAASTASQDADDAVKAAEQAVEDADEYAGKISVRMVHGESMTAQENAQKVLDAKAAVDQAVTDAKAAKTAAETAKTEAEGLPEDTAGRAALIAALDTAIEEADDAIETAEDSQKDRDLKAALRTVQGSNANKPVTPKKVGEGVAMLVGGALGPSGDTDGSGLRHTHQGADEAPGSPAVPTGAAAMTMGLTADNDGGGETWAEIVGDDKVMMKRLGDANANVQVASIAGKTPAAVWASVPQVITDIATTPVGLSELADANYSGIPGSVHCLSTTDCKVDEDGKLAGSWYFEPASPREVYVKVGDATDYTAETMYTRYGHWIVVDAGVVTVQTYAWSDATDASEADLNENADLEGSATYSGAAVGMSLHKTFDSQGEQQSIYSGRFTADVNLEADFGVQADGTGATVEGTVDNFQGTATDPTWSVELRRMALGGERQTDAGATRTGGSGQDGEWNAEAYGAPDVDGADTVARPAGIFGDFNAHWTDGHAAGAFATKKD